MKKTLLLLAMLLNAPLQASQPTTQDIIQLPKGLAYSVGLSNIPTGLLLLMSKYIFGTVDEEQFLLAKKGTSVNHLVNEPIFNKLWIVPPGSKIPCTKLLANHNLPPLKIVTIKQLDQQLRDKNNQNIFDLPKVIAINKQYDQHFDIDKIFWVAKHDCLVLDNRQENTEHHSNQGFKVCFLGKFCCITPYKIAENAYFTPLYSGTYNHPNEQQDSYTYDVPPFTYNYTLKSKKLLYAQMDSRKRTWVKNYPYTTQSSNNDFHQLTRSIEVVKEQITSQEEDQVSTKPRIFPEKVENQDELLSEAEEHEEEISIYD